MKRLLRYVDWLLGLRGYRIVSVSSDFLYLGPQTLEIVASARPLVEKWDGISDVSPEYRRHEVYAALLKRFPEASARGVSKAIEKALDDVRGESL